MLAFSAGGPQTARGQGAAAAKAPAAAPAPPPPPLPRASLPEAVVPDVPRDVTAAKAYAVLERHCARCHQSGRLKDPLPARGIANILALDEIARDPSLVRPGVPDASRLYNSILSRQMPHDVVGKPGAEEPAAIEVQSLRDWIADLPADTARRHCGGRNHLTPQRVAQSIAAALQRLGAEEARQSRFVSLANLYNACASPPEMEGFREAVAALVNSLSWSPEPVRPEPVGEEQAVLRLSLGALGWKASHWELLAQAYPLRHAPSSAFPQPVLDRTGTRLPLLQADWLADAALTPPLYGDLLGLPQRIDNLQLALGADVASDLGSDKARRAGVLLSGELRGNRILQRHATPAGALWMSYDFLESAGARAAVERPLAGLGPGAGQAAPGFDGLRALFQLPNGFPAFSVHDAAGERLPRGTPGIERTWPGWRDAGQRCLMCHTAGPVGARDEVRTQFEADRPEVRELREAVLGLYASQNEIVALAQADRNRTRAGMIGAGIDARRRIWGLPPVEALAFAWRRPADLERVAADSGLEPDALRGRLDALGPDAPIAAWQLRHNVARRDEIVKLLPRLLPDPSAPSGPAPPSATPSSAAATPAVSGEGASDRPELGLWADTASLTVGQTAVFRVLSSEDCHLTLINVDRGGRATVLFPSEIEPGNRITAGRVHSVPGEGAPYRFRFKEPGRETLIAICSRTWPAPAGIHHDYERLRFTVLGDWQIFLRAPPALDEARRDDAATAQPQRIRRRPARGKSKAPEPPRGPDIQARTAITLDIAPAK